MENFDNINVGNLIKNKGSKNVYHVLEKAKDKYGYTLKMVKFLEACNPIEWDDVTPRKIVHINNAVLDCDQNTDIKINKGN